MPFEASFSVGAQIEATKDFSTTGGILVLSTPHHGLDVPRKKGSLAPLRQGPLFYEPRV